MGGVFKIQLNPVVQYYHLSFDCLFLLIFICFVYLGFKPFFCSSLVVLGFVFRFLFRCRFFFTFSN